jgi:predicted transcriptional regulator
MSENQSKPTESELAILGLLWEYGPSTVRQIHERMRRDTGYTSVLKLMQIMTEKGLLLRKRAGKSHVYRPKGSQHSMVQTVVGPLLDRIFGGSTRKLLAAALAAKRTSPAELAEIRQMIDDAAKAAEQKS